MYIYVKYPRDNTFYLFPITGINYESSTAYSWPRSIEIYGLGDLEFGDVSNSWTDMWQLSELGRVG